MAVSPLAEVDRQRIERLVAEVLASRLSGYGMPIALPVTVPAGTLNPLVVNISVRHMHISQQHLEILFGAGAKLTPARWLYQEGQFASEQTVDLVGPKRRMLNNVRILGPTRPESQIELAFSDAILLGIDVPVRMSGKLDGTPGCIVMGPRGHIVLNQGVIRARRHVHMSPEEAECFGVTPGDAMNLIVEHATCPLTVGGIMVRVAPGHKLEVHLDSDEGNACDLPGATGLRLVKAGQRG